MKIPFIVRLKTLISEEFTDSKDAIKDLFLVTNDLNLVLARQYAIISLLMPEEKRKETMEDAIEILEKTIKDAIKNIEKKEKDNAKSNTRH